MIMEDPVVDAVGNTYEKAAIERWLKGPPSHNTSPKTGEVLPNKNLIPNKVLKTQILEFMEDKIKKIMDFVCDQIVKGKFEHVEKLLTHADAYNTTLKFQYSALVIEKIMEVLPDCIKQEDHHEECRKLLVQADKQNSQLKDNQKYTTSLKIHRMYIALGKAMKDKDLVGQHQLELIKLLVTKDNYEQVARVFLELQDKKGLVDVLTEAQFESLVKMLVSEKINEVAEAINFATFLGDHYESQEDSSAAEVFFQFAFDLDKNNEELYAKLFKSRVKQGKTIQGVRATVTRIFETSLATKNVDLGKK